MLTRWISLQAFAMLLLWSAAAGAQDVTRPASAANLVTMTGCVERADQLAAAAPISPTVDADSRQFVLMPTLPPEARKQTADAHGAKATQTRPLYRLDADVSTITPHVGHEVEVQGIVTAAAAPAPGAQDIAPIASAARLKVESIRTVAQTCAR